jgi:regulator of protease activity HflC (stomatin/prohibitin superfamily)
MLGNTGGGAGPEQMKSTYILIGVIAFIFLAMSSITIVGTGERGVRATFGSVHPKSLPEGLYFKIPLIQTIKKYDVKIVRSIIRTEAYTQDIQTANITYVLNYSLKPEFAPEMARTVGPDYEAVLIRPITEGILKDVIGRWNADTLVNNREQAAKQIQDATNTALNEKGISIFSVNITDIKYAPDFERAIEAKVKAQQEALQAQNITVRIEEEAKQRLISARAESESMRIRAQALTQNQALVQYEAVQKWDGKLPQYMMGNSVPFINIK